MAPHSLAEIQDDKFLLVQGWMFMTQKGIPDTGFMTATISFNLYFMVRIH